MRLKSDIYSHVRPTHKYGSANEEIKIISDRGKVVIVEVLSGDRFTVKKEMIIGETIKEIKTEAVPDATVPHKTTINNRVQASKKKAAPTNQKSLFE